MFQEMLVSSPGFTNDWYGMFKMATKRKVFVICVMCLYSADRICILREH